MFSVVQKIRPLSEIKSDFELWAKLCSPPNSHVEVLLPSTSECGVIWSLEARCTNSCMRGIWPALPNGGPLDWAGGRERPWGFGLPAPPLIRVLGDDQSGGAWLGIRLVGCCSATS